MPNTQYSTCTSNDASAETPVGVYLSWVDGGRLCEIIPSTDTFSWVGGGKCCGVVLACWLDVLVFWFVCFLGLFQVCFFFFSLVCLWCFSILSDCF